MRDKYVQADLLLLSAGPPPTPWANRSSAHELEGGISVKTYTECYRACWA